MSYADIDWSLLTLFCHDEVTINSFGETLDRDSYSVYNSNRRYLVDQMKRQIMAEEDELIFKILGNIAKSGNNVI